MRKVDNSARRSYSFTAHLGTEELQERRFEHYPLEEQIARAWLDMLIQKWYWDPNSGLDSILNTITNERDAQLISSTVVWLVGTAVWSSALREIVENVGGKFTPPMPSDDVSPNNENIKESLWRIPAQSIVHNLLLPSDVLNKILSVDALNNSDYQE